MNSLNILKNNLLIKRQSIGVKMGYFVEGQWVTDNKWASKSGEFVRKATTFRNWVTKDGAPGSSGKGGFAAEKNRYHLYISLACPWAHRTLIFRKLKGLEDFISLSVVNAYMGDEGWTFDDGDDVIKDTVNGKTHLHQVYTMADPQYSGRVTVPVLWDKKTNTIVNNESSEIIRMFNHAFDDIGAKPGDYYPKELRGEIDELNALIYPNVNNGVYRSGFATSQEAYHKAVTELFNVLDQLEERLSQQRYLTGNRLTEADWRLFTTLIRFDAVYVGHFKCNLRRLQDYPNLSAYLRDLYQVPSIAETIKMDHIKHHYYASHGSINPTRIVPKGPILDFTAPHGRDNLK